MRKQSVNKKVIKREISCCSFLGFLILRFSSFSAAPHSFLIVNDFYVSFLFQGTALISSSLKNAEFIPHVSRRCYKFYSIWGCVTSLNNFFSYKGGYRCLKKSLSILNSKLEEVVMAITISQSRIEFQA